MFPLLSGATTTFDIAASCSLFERPVIGKWRSIAYNGGPDSRQGELMGENDDDMDLLYSDPSMLLSRLQKVFVAVARLYRRSGMLRDEELSEIVQEMNLQFLNNLETIRKNYDPSRTDAATLRAYVRSLARNVCNRYYRERPQYSPLSLSHPRVTVSADSVTDPLAIAQTVQVFRAVIDTSGDRKAKLLLFLKLYYRIPVVANDLRGAYPEADEVVVGAFLGLFGGDFASMGEMSIFEAARPIINQLERSETTAESYTRWITREVTEICEILNGDPPVSAFDRHTLRILVDDYFEPFLERRIEPSSAISAGSN